MQEVGGRPCAWVLVYIRVAVESLGGVQGIISLLVEELRFIEREVPQWYSAPPWGNQANATRIPSS